MTPYTLLLDELLGALFGGAMTSADVIKAPELEEPNSALLIDAPDHGPLAVLLRHPVRAFSLRDVGGFFELVGSPMIGTIPEKKRLLVSAVERHGVPGVRAQWSRVSSLRRRAEIQGGPFPPEQVVLVASNLIEPIEVLCRAGAACAVGLDTVALCAGTDWMRAVLLPGADEALHGAGTYVRSLGALMYAMLVGPAIDGEHDRRRLEAACPALAEIVIRALEADGDGGPSLDELRRALDEADVEPIRATIALEGKVFPLDRDELVLGRGKGSDILIDSINVSRRHLKLIRRKGFFAAVDLDTSGGTWIGDDQYGDFVWLGGDTLHFGATLRYEAPSSCGESRRATHGRRSP